MSHSLQPHRVTCGTNGSWLASLRRWYLAIILELKNWTGTNLDADLSAGVAAYKEGDFIEVAKQNKMRLHLLTFIAKKKSDEFQSPF